MWSINLIFINWINESFFPQCTVTSNNHTNEWLCITPATVSHNGYKTQYFKLRSSFWDAFNSCWWLSAYIYTFFFYADVKSLFRELQRFKERTLYFYRSNIWLRYARLLKCLIILSTIVHIKSKCCDQFVLYWNSLSAIYWSQYAIKKIWLLLSEAFSFKLHANINVQPSTRI